MSKTTITYKDIAPGADRTAEFSGTQYEEFSQLTELRNEHEQQNIATLEQNLWMLDGSFEGFGEDGQAFPFWSDVLSDENCNLNPQPAITINFPAQYSTTAITLQFDEVLGARASEFNVKWYRGGAVVADADFYPTDALALCAKRAEMFDRIIITFRKTSLPYRRVKLRQIIFGIIRKFGMDEIRSARVTNQTSLASLELPVSTLDWTLDSKEDIDFMFQFRQPVEVKNDDFIIGVYYIAETSRTSKSVYSLHCQDALGVLDNDIIPGGFYSNYSAKKLLTEIIGDDFEIDFGDVEDKLLTGLLEPMTKRLAVQNVVFGWGVCIATDGGDALRVFRISDASEYIGLDRAYTGVSVDTSAAITALTITAHDYKEDPNGTIEVDGKKYSDTPTTYTINNDGVTQNDKANVIEIDGASFINSSNVGDAALRIYNYYMQRDVANVKIVWRGEFAGDCVEVPDAWNGLHKGNIEQMDMVLSNTVAAELRVISGEKSIFPHEHRVVITASGKWTAPAGVASLWVALIGKGADGADGQNGTFYSAGADGTDGVGGKVWSKVVYIGEGQTFDVSIGENTVFGQYSSADGETRPGGYVDIMTGEYYGRTGIASPAPGSGDGGRGGVGGTKGEQHSPTGWMSDMVIDKVPGPGGKGVNGATGCVIIYYDKKG